ncbi:hypothetical protein GCM10010988_39470 [Cnuibacter physcomitrellae]|uniref:Uncharacterized protein n=1 Tax=Cnuibacter physcomitrellae TaxID=1619308 RepID=A0A1X9LSX2_9MICO|nr:hypothetical protein [Cnuibacter physcomitrellae]ARJ07522.1 hypothetical protein B5808_19155 [Cnuibacter physcomitrellae]GGI42524.1 hypothetical protein GCM10010988_39470 [Cnuibacter physcomitrellae]
MITRVWFGEILTEDAAAYRECADSVRVPRTRAAVGNFGVWVMLRDVDAGYTQVMILSYWASLADVELWAGYDIEKPRLFPEEDHFFIAGDSAAKHFTFAAGAPAVDPTAADRGDR